MNKKPKIFLVDDDKFLLELYRKKFEQADMEVETAVGSEETLSKLRDGLVPDVMLLDVIMPDMDGIELLRIIRKERLAESMIVVMLTNESGIENIEMAKTLKVHSYIVKAMKIPTEVVEEVREIIKSK